MTGHQTWRMTESEPEGQQSEDCSPSEDELEDEDPFPNPILFGIGFEAMLRSVWPSKKSVTKDGGREI